MKSLNSVDNFNNGTDVNNAGNVNSTGNVNNAGNANNAGNQSNVKKESNDSGTLKEKVALIYMAAGNSRRFGENKLLYKIDGKPMYLHLFERLCEICGNDAGYSLYLVTRYDEIMKTQCGGNFEAVYTPLAKDGASYTVKAALEAARNFSAYVFFAADQPYLTAQTVSGFLNACRKSGKGLGCVCSSGETGNPAWFDAKYVKELFALEGDRGGKAVIKRHTDDLFLYEVENAHELDDIDFLNDRKN